MNRRWAVPVGKIIFLHLGNPRFCTDYSHALTLPQIADVVIRNFYGVLMKAT